MLLKGKLPSPDGLLIRLEHLPNLGCGRNLTLITDPVASQNSTLTIVLLFQCSQNLLLEVDASFCLMVGLAEYMRVYF